MLEFDFEQSLGCWIALTNQSLRRALTARLADEGITIRQWEVLACAAFKQHGLSQVELAEMLGIEAPTLAGILSRMERDGWLVRETCPRDKRRKLIRPSDKVNEVWERMVQCCFEVRAEATAGFTPEELATLKKFCERIRSNLESPADQSCTPNLGTSPGVLNQH
jgi:DNA-binding MarR family transcriptional regulator